MSRENLKKRTKLFALEIIRLFESSPLGQTCKILGNQLCALALRSGQIVAPACRSKSTADFISKMGTVKEEADESCYWIEPLVESGKAKIADVSALFKEAGELIAIAVSSINTSRKSGGCR